MAASSVPKLVNSSILSKVASENSKALRELKKVNPRERYVALFPDADSAYVGMGFKMLGLKTAEQIYDQASEIAKKDVLKLCLNGPKTDLYKYQENSQLATFVTTHARLSVLADERPEVVEYCKVVGGIGVGLVNGLVFSGAMSFENGLELILKRSQAMDKVARIVPSARLKLRVKAGTQLRKVSQAAIEHCLKMDVPKEIAICSVSKQKRPHVIEIAGHEEAIKFLELEGTRLFEFLAIQRIQRVSFAFNTELMAPVKDFMKVYLDEKMKDDPNYLIDPVRCSIHSATSGRRVRYVKSIKKDLTDYPVKPIHTEALLRCLFDRPQNVAQPNVLVLGDRNLLETLSSVNRRAASYAKLLRV